MMCCYLSVHIQGQRVNNYGRFQDLILLLMFPLERERISSKFIDIVGTRPQILFGSPAIELDACHPSGTSNFEVALDFEKFMQAWLNVIFKNALVELKHMFRSQFCFLPRVTVIRRRSLWRTTRVVLCKLVGAGAFPSIFLPEDGSRVGSLCIVCTVGEEKCPNVLVPDRALLQERPLRSATEANYTYRTGHRG